MIEFFMPMVIPTITYQEKKMGVNKAGKPFTYEQAELKDARQKFEAYLSQHKPATKLQGAVRLTVKWCFKITGQHMHGEYKTTKPDCSNLIKLLEDCMTAVGFWQDDAQVASELNEKFWSRTQGIYIKIEEVK